MQSKVKIGASEHSKCKTELNNALITNCDVMQQNIQTVVLAYRPDEMWSVQKTKDTKYFPYGTNNWLARALFYSAIAIMNIVVILLGSYRKFFGKLMKYHSKPIF